MAKSNLELQVATLESHVAELQHQLASTPGKAEKDCRRTIGMFTDDEGMKSIFAEALKIRETDRKKPPTRRIKRGGEKA